VISLTLMTAQLIVDGVSANHLPLGWLPRWSNTDLTGAIVADCVNLKRVLSLPKDLPNWPCLPSLGLAVNAYEIEQN